MVHDMAILSVDLLQRQLRLDDEIAAAEAMLLQAYLSAAEAHISARLGRNLYAAASDIPETDGYGIVLTDHPDVVLAVMLLGGHYYNNREAVTDGQLAEIPLGVAQLIGPLTILYPEIKT